MKFTRFVPALFILVSCSSPSPLDQAPGLPQGVNKKPSPYDYLSDRFNRPKDPIYQRSISTGYLLVEREDGKGGRENLPCSAVVITSEESDEILTANHCVTAHERSPHKPISARLYMNYYTDELLQNEKGYAVNLDPIHSSDYYDYAILQVFGDLSNYRPVTLSTIPPADSDSALIYHHPNFERKAVSRGDCVVKVWESYEEFFFHLCQTKGGSSGGPMFLLNENPNVISGLHVRGEDFVRDTPRNVIVTTAAIMQDLAGDGRDIRPLLPPGESVPSRRPTPVNSSQDSRDRDQAQTSSSGSSGGSFTDLAPPPAF